MSFTRKDRGFTLIELLTVLTVISIFMGLLFPIGEKFVKKSRRMADETHLRQLALAYTDLLSEDDSLVGRFSQAKNAYEWAGLLAQFGHMNDPHLYVAQEDPNLATVKNFPAQIGYYENDTWVSEPEFQTLPLSWVFIVGIPKNAPLHTTPLAYSRGLQLDSGRWSEDSAYGPQGGLVVFLDGHVQFYPNLNNQLVHYKTRKRTGSLRDAVPPSAHAVDDHGSVW